MLCEQCYGKVKTPATKRQREVLEYIQRFERDKGYTPSYAQVARFFRLSSKATIWKHVRALRRQGFLTAPAKDKTDESDTPKGKGPAAAQ